MPSGKVERSMCNIFQALQSLLLLHRLLQYSHIYLKFPAIQLVNDKIDNIAKSLLDLQLSKPGLQVSN